MNSLLVSADAKILGCNHMAYGPLNLPQNFCLTA